MATPALREPGEVVRAEGLGKSYRRTPAVGDVSFEIGRGEVFGLLGPDGAGKSTLIQILTGVLSATRGRARVLGEDVLARPEAVKSRIGYMPQGLGLNLYEALTVEENIDFFGDLREVPPEDFRRHKEELLGITQLAPFRDRAAAHLSGGMRQKLALCCTLIHYPELIFLDEPTTGVDPISRRDFWMIINRLVVERGTSVLLTTSYLDEAERCHRVAFLYQGRIIAQGPTAELQEQTGRNGAGRSRSLEDVFIAAMAVDTAEAAAAGPRPLPVAAPRGAGEEAAAIRVEGLSKRFGDFMAVDGVSFAVASGEVFGFLGPNGAGKTTVIKILTGILAPSRGRARIAGLDIRADRDRLKRQLGYMSQKFSLYRDLTVAENIRLYGGIYQLRRDDLEARLPEILELADLRGQEEQLARDLPLGMRQRLALGCAILHRPRIVFLDEPTSGVDPLARRKFWRIIRQLAEAGVTILVSTHYMDEAEHCGRLAFMHQGRLVAVGAPGELRARAEAAVGRILDVATPGFGEAFMQLRQHFPGAFLQGRRIHIPSLRPAEDADRIREILAGAGLGGEQILENSLSMEDTFIHFVQAVEHVS